MAPETGEGRTALPSTDAQDVGDLLLRVVSFVAGGGLAYGLFLSSAFTAPDQAAVLWTSVVGSGGALALYWWHARRGMARTLRWYGALGLAVGGAVLAHLILGMASSFGNVSAMLFAVGAAVSIAVPHGLILGTAVALMLHGLRGPATRRPRVDVERKPDSVVLAATSQGDDQWVPDPPPPSARRLPRIVQGVAGTVLLLAPTIVYLTIAPSTPLTLWSISFALCAAISATWIGMARRHRPLRSWPILLQVVTVVALSCAAGLSLLLFVLSPLAGILVGLFYGAAVWLLLRATHSTEGDTEETHEEGASSPEDSP